MAKSTEFTSTSKPSLPESDPPAAGTSTRSPAPLRQGEDPFPITDLDTPVGEFIQREPPPPEVLRKALPALLELIDPEERARILHSYLDRASDHETYRLWFGIAVLGLLVIVIFLGLVFNAPRIAATALGMFGTCAGWILYVRSNRHKTS